MGSEQAWADFWRGGGRGPESGCLPKALQQIHAVQRRVWHEVAAGLPRNARVLDLATGDGAVLGMLRERRPDLKLVGVDSSAVLPKGLKGAELKPRVRMEQLPFPAASFDLVTSQFGIEYGDVPAIAAQLTKVLRPGAAFAFVIHHAGGPIVAHNDARVASLNWALHDSGLLTKAEAVARARTLADLPTPPTFRAAPAEARRLFPGQDVAVEFATAVQQTLDMGRRHPPAETLEVLATLRAKAGNEMARIQALKGAARDESGIIALRADLAGAGLAADAPELLFESSGRAPFAWRLAGRRPA
jgi:SAM-dependent methyltransferase